MSYLIGFLIGFLFMPAVRELWKAYRRDGWDKIQRKRVKAMRDLYGYHTME